MHRTAFSECCVPIEGLSPPWILHATPSCEQNELHYLHSCLLCRIVEAPHLKPCEESGSGSTWQLGYAHITWSY